jgi:hypothetical protein
MIFDGTIESLQEIRKVHPSAKIYGYQTKLPDGTYVFDPMYGEGVLVIEDRPAQPGRVFDRGMEVV